jgi:hypothetical protein
LKTVKRNLLLFSFIALFLIIPLAGFSQTQEQDEQLPGPKLILEADHQKIRAAQTVTITLRAEYPAEYKISGSLKDSYPVIEGLHQQGVHISSYNRFNALISESTAQTYKAPKEDTYTIEPVSIRFIDPGGNLVDVTSNGLTVVVIAEDAPEEGLRNIKGLKPLRKPLNWLLISTIGAVLFALILIIVVASGRKRKPLTAPVPLPSRYAGPEEEFIDMLLKLDIPDEYDAEAVKKLYLLMSEYIRSYLSARWDISARKETTTEVLSEFRRAGFLDEVLNKYKSMAKAFDMVKYAKGRPFKPDIEAARDAAIEFIRFMGDLRR